LEYTVKQQHRSDLDFRTKPGIVVQYSRGSSEPPARHECVTRAEMAKKLALLKGYDFAGEYDCATRSARPLYFVPSETLVGIEAARQLGIVTEDDLFGGVVP
jgi:hypothetical protein